ncbi:cytochrome P450 [Aulographum hederae CBS 113979]|uniref:Cytochrome P450 n=1 Tax=Aulographum hederae CBS 113979 TaxID=1176131 RepID=A0A6G1GZF6_9PEZI|nr:cytochrome P450 [Aulographum hederae CBS 113979]
MILFRFRTVGKNTFDGFGVFNERLITTAEPENIKAMLAANFGDWAIGERRARQFGPLLGRGIFNADGEGWRHARGLLRPQFSRESINDLEGTEEAVRIMFRGLEVGEDGWTQEVDLKPMFFNFTLDNAVEFLYGTRLNTQATYVASMAGKNEDIDGNRSEGSPTVSEAQELGKALQIANEYLSHRVRAQQFYYFVDGARFRKSLFIVKEFTGKYIQRALNIRKKSTQTESSEKEKKYSLVDELVDTTKDPEELREQLLSLLIAGRDTTASLLSWTFLLLAHHPSTFHTLRTQILSFFPLSPSSPANPLNYTSLKSLPLLHNVLHESLRLYPILPMNNRIAVRDTILPVGGGEDEKSPVMVPKGTTVNYSVYVMQRRKDLWGEDADEFRPGRWEEGKMRKGDRGGWGFLPFNGGPRICIGQQYALTEASYLVVRMLQQFDRIEWAGPEGRPRKAMGLTISPKDGVRVRLRRAKVE